MKLYRARLTSQRPQRHPPFLGNGPEHRVRGRWFTSNAEDARRHGEDNLAGQDWEMIVVEVKDDFAELHRVATTPKTPCGLDPIQFAIDPETEYVIPTWVAMDARAVGADGLVRERDYLFRTKSAIVLDYAEKNDIPAIDIKIAA